MASLFSKPKSPSTPSELGAISTDLPMMPAPSLSPLPQTPFQFSPNIQPTNFAPQVQRQPQRGSSNLDNMLRQLGAFGA